MNFSEEYTSQMFANSINFFIIYFKNEKIKDNSIFIRIEIINLFGRRFRYLIIILLDSIKNVKHTF